MSAPIPVTLIGATGLTGSHTLSSLLASTTSPFSITTLARRAPSSASAIAQSSPSTTHRNRVFPDLFAAPADQSEPLVERGGVFVSCLGTTRAQAGGIANQRKLDLDLNVEFAERAFKDGARTYILVSSAGTSSDSYLPYGKMKGELDDHVKAMGWERCVILRPGFLLGQREGERGSGMENTAQKIYRGLGSVGVPFMKSTSTEASDVGQCIAYYAANPPSDKVTVVDNEQIKKAAKQWREANGKL